MGHIVFLTNKTCKRSGSHLEDQAYICPCRWYLQAENMSIGHHYLSHVSVSFTGASFVFWDGICSIVLHCNYYEKHDPAWIGSPFVFVVVTNDFSYPKIFPLPFLFSFPSLIKYHHSTNTVLLLLPLFNWSSSLKNCDKPFGKKPFKNVDL